MWTFPNVLNSVHVVGSKVMASLQFRANSQKVITWFMAIHTETTLKN